MDMLEEAGLKGVIQECSCKCDQDEKAQRAQRGVGRHCECHIPVLKRGHG